MLHAQPGKGGEGLCAEWKGIGKSLHGALVLRQEGKQRSTTFLRSANSEKKKKRGRTPPPPPSAPAGGRNPGDGFFSGLDHFEISSRGREKGDSSCIFPEGKGKKERNAFLGRAWGKRNFVNRLKRVNFQAGDSRSREKKKRGKPRRSVAG